MILPGKMPAVFAAIATILTACAPDDGTIVGDFEGFRPCSSLSDCEPGDVCSVRYGFCFRPMPPDAGLVVSITPAPDSAAIPDQFNDAACTEPGTLNLTLTPRTMLSGRVLPPEGPLASAYRGDGRIIADAPGRIPGFRFRHEAAATAGADGSSWEISMAPDLRYTMTFVPDDTTAPTVSWSVDAGVSGAIDLQVDAPMFQIRGVVRRYSGPDRVPVAGVVVQALAGGRAATSSETDENGVFGLTIPESASPITIQVVPGNSGAVFPPRSLEWADIDELKTELPRTGFLAIDIDPVPEVATISFQVLSVALGGGRVPMAGSQVFMERTDEDGTFKKRSTVDGNGFCTLTLPSGNYNVAVLPPGGGPDVSLKSRHFAMANRAVSFAGGDDRIFGVELLPRPTLSGRVVSAGSAGPVTGAVVVVAATSAAIDGWASSFDPDLMFQAVTDENGEFSMPVEPGTWALQVRPPAGTGLGASSWPEVELTGTENLRIELGGACLLSGRLVAPTGEPQEGALMTFFEPTSTATWNAWPMKHASWANSIRAVGSVKTGVDGHWETLLPCPDEQAAVTGGVVRDW